MSKLNHKPRFEGALAKSIPGASFVFAMEQLEANFNKENQEKLERAWREVELEQYIKIPLLLDHYGIDQNLSEEIRNHLLVFALAQDVVPGFMVDRKLNEQPGRGRPKKIPAKMLYDFAKLRRAGIGPSEAVRKLNAKGPWKNAVPHGINARYSEHDRQGSLDELFRKVEEDERTK